jgi:hypothetical protein
MIAACAAVARATVQGFFGSEPSKVWLFATHIQHFPSSCCASLVPDFAGAIRKADYCPTLRDATNTGNVFGRAARDGENAWTILSTKRGCDSLIP